MIEEIRKYLAFWEPLELTINAEPITFYGGDKLTINKYISPLTRTISLKNRLVLLIHNIKVEYRDATE